MGKPKSLGRLPLISPPIFAGVVVKAHDVPMLLHVDGARAGFVNSDAMDAVADLGGGIGQIIVEQALGDGLPGLAAVIGAEAAGRGDGDVDAVRIGRIDQDGVQPHAAGRLGGPFVGLGSALKSRTFPASFLRHRWI